MLLGQYTKGSLTVFIIFLWTGLHHLSFHSVEARERNGVCSESAPYFRPSVCRHVFIESVCTVLVSAIERALTYAAKESEGERIQALL
jgi:hypothetical protein